MGSVYEVKDLNVAGKVRAAKEILDSALHGPHAEYVQSKFQSEMRSLAGLNHPGIPQVIDFFQVGQASYIIMDYVQGLNLEDELRQRMCETGQPSPPEQVASDALEVLDILAYLHSQDPPVLHRDIKPSNLIRNAKTGKVILVDFGLARSHQEGEQQTRVGTPGYCSQEQMAGKAEPRSDLYSLAVTLYHLLSGKTPRMLTCEPLCEVIPGFDPDLSAIMDRATQLKVRERFPDAAAMAEEFERWLKRQKRKRLEAEAEPLLDAAPKLTSHLGALLGGAALLVILVAGIWVGSSRGNDPLVVNATETPENFPLAYETRSLPVVFASNPSAVPPVDDEDYFSSNLHRHHGASPPQKPTSKPPTVIPQPHVPRLPAGTVPLSTPKGSEPTDGSGFAHWLNGAALPIENLVRVPEHSGFKREIEPSQARFYWRGRGGHRHGPRLTVEAFAFHVKPSLAIEQKLAHTKLHESESVVTRGQSNTVQVTYRGLKNEGLEMGRSGFYLFRAIPYKGGSIVYSFHGAFASEDPDPRAQEMIRELMGSAQFVDSPNL